MSLFIYVLADVIHFTKILLVCNMFFAFRRREFSHNKVMLVFAGSVMAAVSAFIYIYDNHIAEMVIYVIAMLLLIYMLYREKIQSVVLVVIWMISAIAMIDIMIAVLFDISMDLLSINGELISNLVVSVISLMIVYGVGRIYRKNAASSMQTVGVINVIGFTILLAVDTVVVTVIAVMNVELNLERNRNIYLLSLVFVIIGIFIQLAAVVLLFTQRNVYKEKEALTDKYLNEQKSHYEYLENREQETKKFRHDLRSHMEIISNLANNHDYERINRYLEQMHMRIDSFGNIVTVQNGIVDAIINQYYTKAVENDIKMEVKGRLPADCAIDAFDLCTIFSNILSNAYEAAIDTEEKYISLECRYNDKNIIIVVKNSFDSEVQTGTMQWKTKKSDTDHHGYGLENIKDSVKKYKGVFDIDAKESMFILTILFNNTL